MAIFGDKQKEKKEKVARVTHARVKLSTAGEAHDIIRSPWLSEKSLLATEKNVYSFHVSSRATKAEIAGAVKEIYSVTPKQIRVVNLPGKTKTMRTKRGTGQRAARRKAYVYLNKGDTIQFA